MPKKLLLADDSVTIQKVISITFASDDYELVVVGDGDSAIARAKEESPDIILADVAMPGKNGYEVCEAIKADPTLSRIPVMLLAGTFEPLDSDEATRVKADDSIVKPFESQELIDKVNSLLANSFSSNAAPSTESSFELPEDDFGAGDIPGVEEVGEAGPDLDFLEGGIFEEPAAQNVATSHAPFVDLEITDEELTTADTTPEILDISAATGAEDNDADFGLADIGDSSEAFSFEPEAESLEVKEVEPAEQSAEPFELETIGAETEQEEAGIEEQGTGVTTEQPFEIEHLGADAEPFELETLGAETEQEEAGKEQQGIGADTEQPFEIEHLGASAEPFREEPQPFKAATDTGFEPELIGTPEEAVDFGAPDFELDSGIPEPGSSGGFEEPAVEGAIETTPELQEEPVLEEAAVSEELIDSLDEDFNAEPVAEPVPVFEAETEPEPVELYEAALEELEPEATPAVETAETIEPVESVAEASVEAVVEQSLDAVAAATASITDSLPADKVEEIVNRVAREVIEKVAWEVVPEMAEELINAEIKKFKAIMMQSK